MGLTGYMMIGMAVLGLALAGSLWALKSSYEQNGALQAAAENNAHELQRAVDKIEEVKALRAHDQARILALGEHANKLIAERDAAALKLDKWRSTLDARTLAKPEVTRRAARAALRIRQCRLWADTGGQGSCPR